MFNQGEYNYVFEQVVQHIERDAAERRGVRVLYRNYMAKNNWNSQGMQDVMGILNRVSVDIMRSRDLVSTLNTLIKEIIDGHCAITCLSSNDVAGQLPGNIYQVMQQQAQMFQNKWLNPSGMFGANNSSAFNQGSGTLYGAASSGNGFSGSGSGFGVTNPPGNTHNPFPSLNTQNNVDSRFSYLLPPTPAQQQTAMLQDAYSDPFPTTAKPAPQVTSIPKPGASLFDPAPVVTPAPATNYKVESEPEGIDMSKPRPFDTFIINGERWEFALKSNLFTVDDFGVPSPLSFYNARKYLPYYVNDGKGTVTEEFMEIKPDSRYLMMETMNDAALYSSENVRRAATFSSRRSLTENPIGSDSAEEIPMLCELIAGLDTSELKSDVEHKVAANIEDAKTQAKQEMASQGKDAVIVPFMVLDRVSVVGFDLETQYKLVDALSACTTLKELHAEMKNLKSLMDPELFKAVNNRITTFLLESLQKQWQFQIRRMSFFEHFDQLLTTMGKLRGLEYVANFLERTNAIIYPALLHLGSQEEVIEHLGLEGIQTKNPPIVFPTFEYMISIRYSADQLGIGTQLQNRDIVKPDGTKVYRYGSALRELTDDDKIAPNMRDLYSKLPVAESERRFQTVRILTRDGLLINVQPYHARFEEFIMSEA